ncbi:MAG: SEL1-like repeat protein [Rhodoferax sp.]|nr:SEL1-like repeat protein [Rhodoferax sp.]
MTASSNLRDKRNFERTLKEARIGTLEAQYELALMYANGVGVAVDVGKAIQWLQQAATKGLSSAQFLLATRYLSGIGVERDETAALQWLTKAAAQGNAKALYRLGRFLESPHRDAALKCLGLAAQAGLPEAQWAWARATLGSGNAPPELMRQAYDYLVEVAEQGMPAAQNALGELYLQGRMVAVDTEQALDWYRRAAAQGSLQAIVALTRMELVGTTRSASRSTSSRRKSNQERRRSPHQWLVAAESGDADTRYHLGLIYEMGWSVAADADQAQHWYRSAAQQGDARAQLALGRVLEKTGAFEALDWYRKGAEQGDAEAQFALARNLSSGTLLPRDSLQGLAWYLRAAEQGHAAALVTVGGLLAGDMGDVAMGCYERAAALGVAHAQYRVGERLLGAARSPDALQQAQQWLMLAARQGHAAAQCEIGLMCLEGRGMACDKQVGVDWLSKAAEQGEARAQWNLGSMYANGAAGLTRDIAKALQWCRLAADQEFAAAQATLGALYARMEHWDQAQHWLERAAAQDDPEALFNLAVLSLQSKLQNIPQEHALTYLCRAADRGLAAAQSRLGLAYAKGEGVALDPIEAHKWFLIASRLGDAAAAANLAHSTKLVADAPAREARRRAEIWFKTQLA